MCIYKRTIFFILCSIFHTNAPAFAEAAGVLVYDSNEPEISKEAKKAGDAAIGIVSVKDAADKPPINRDFVILAGHGASGIIGLGSGESSDYQKGKDLKVDKLEDVKENLETVNSKLKGGTTVLLSGCNTGAGEDGQKLVVQLAKIVSKATIYANKACVGLSAPQRKKVCAYEKQGTRFVGWQLSSIVGANKDGLITIGRDDVKKVKNSSCVTGS